MISRRKRKHSGSSASTTAKTQKCTTRRRSFTNTQPEPDYTMFSQVELVKYYIRTGDLAKGDEEYNRLVTEFAENQWLPSSICFIGDTYLRAGDTNLASLLYNKVAATWPDDPQTIYAKAGLAKVAAQLGKDSEVNKIIDEIRNDYAGNPDVASSIFGVGEHYWKLALAENKKIAKADDSQPDFSIRNAYFSSAHTILELVVSEFPSSSVTPEAAYFAAEASRCLGLNQEAAVAYQKVVDTWPDFKFARVAQNKVIKIYKKFLIDGSMPRVEARKEITKGYENMIEKFPDSASAERARRNLVYVTDKEEPEISVENMSMQEIDNYLQKRDNEGGSK